ncbi:intermembrane transport protein PqiB [Salinisphaera sp. RV14]|uniref:PqiB family protein n=1 Tax=unclassified Salinisphaera TaxID=2649847 RepID=UPI003F875C04
MPLAALIIVGYLVVRTWLLAGPTITIIFPKAAGISSSGSSLQYKGVQVGQVENVELTPDRHAVKVTVGVQDGVSDFLRSGTQFWVTQPSILSGQLGALLSGPNIIMQPGPGHKSHRFTGLLHPPATAPNQAGRSVTLYASSANGLQYGTPVVYHGLKAGKVLATGYDSKRNAIRIKLFIKKPFAGHLHDAGTVRFWRASSFGVATDNAGVHVDIPPLDEILHGGIAFDVMGSSKQAAGAPTIDPHLYASADAASTVMTGRHLLFSTRLASTAAGDIGPGTPVKLDGIRVGTVRHVSLTYDPRQQAMQVPVTFDLYPDRFGFKKSATNKPAGFDQVLATLVKKGLRVQLTTANLVLGSRQLSLVMAGSAGQATLDTSANPPRIPAVETAGINSVLASVSQLTQTLNAKVKGVPLKAIGRHVLKSSARAQALLDSPQVAASIRHLDRTLANAQAITAAANGQVGPTLKSLRQVSESARQTANTINRLAGGSLGDQQNMQQLVSELTQTARSVRGLANYLQQHPEALLYGKKRH